MLVAFPLHLATPNKALQKQIYAKDVSQPGTTDWLTHQGVRAERVILQ